MASTRADPVSLRQFLLGCTDAVAGAQLRARFGPSAVKRAVARGELVRVLPDVYAPTCHAQSFQVRAHAAAMWAGGAVSGAAALFWWGLLAEPPKVIEVLVAHGHNPRPQPGVRIRRSTVELPRTMRNGVPVVSPAVAVVLGYGSLPRGQRSEVFYGAVRRRLVGVNQLEAILTQQPRVKARRALERSVRAAGAGAQSYLEERALFTVFNSLEFTRFVRQHEVVIEGNQYFLDMFDPATKTAIELDGRKGHLNEFRQKNITRDCWVATVGIQTLRFSYDDLLARPEWCRQIVREVLRLRAVQNRVGVRT